MAYSTNSDVIDEFKSLPTSGTSAITTTKIDEWISQADAFIDGRIGLLYETPVTGTNSLIILKEISIGLVAQRVAKVLELKSTTPKGDQIIPKDLIEKANNRLNMIVKRELLLSDATERSSSGGVRSYTEENNVSRSFKQGTDQW